MNLPKTRGGWCVIHVILHMYESVEIFAKIPKLKDFQDQIHLSTNDHHPIYHFFISNMQQSLASYCVVHYVIHCLVISNKK